MLPTISVIIPTNHSPVDLIKVVDAICLQTVKPSELIIIDSFSGSREHLAGIAKRCHEDGLKLVYVQGKNTLPGHARNIGLIHSKMQMVGFIDVHAIPRPNWIEASLQLFKSEDVQGVWGSTYFCADTFFERLARDSFYGSRPRKTLPGSLFRRDSFAKCGMMIDWVRAGEDTEWMIRVELLRLKTETSNSALIDYVGLKGLTLMALLKKWHRNYSACRDLPHFFPQKLLLWTVLYPLIILLAFNWNHLIADWRIDSPFYIGHITKLALILPPSAYIIGRGMISPIRRGVGITKLFPFRFIAISILCFLGDSIKALVFTMPWLKK